MKRITVLGATGSIGTNTLDVLARHREDFEVFALTGARQVEPMLALCVAHRPREVVMVDPPAARELAQRLAAEGLGHVVVHTGPEALDSVASHPEVDMVMAAIVGAAGLSPCLAAARAGKRLLLANKEALVVGGEVFLAAVREGGATLLPIDSEHSAIFQSLPDDRSAWERRVDKIILTASGGPFRTLEPQALRDVTPEQACAHPNWVMGRKISVDSASMMNKGLEVIEARYLFGLGPERLDVVIHPQSIVHSMVQYRDGSIVAQLGTPDMRVPIAYGLSWPERIASGAANLDFSRLSAMTFESVHDAAHQLRFPCLALAWQALRGPTGSTAILNAANEVAVEAFLQRRIRFDQIATINAQCLAKGTERPPTDLGSLLELDRRTREHAEAEVKRWGAA
ncbi:MAG: 1-deoxy-D-xylulose-5-phosphate reductoisomerase [Limnohabitans sp.]|nr:1-deoxy-D-xylulose-5-phosphate reductoisomerase [Limnohabitans sp.]